LNDATKAASRKASLSVRDLLIRSFLAGGLLAYATSLVFIVLSQNVAPIVGAILFPVGFVILVLLGLELATGNFALLPMGWAAGEVSFLGMLRNLGWVYLGNLAEVCLRLPVLLGGDELRHRWQGAVGELMKCGAERPSHTWPSASADGKPPSSKESYATGW
jgi:formate/nitrite transporter FocA (FNT family)